MDRNEEVCRVTLPLTKAMATIFRMGERILRTGPIYTLRDAGHQRLVTLLERGEEPPFPLEGAVIFYVGPTPPLPGNAMGSAGPTTSYRMDPYAPALISRGLRGMIGKGLPRLGGDRRDEALWMRIFCRYGRSGRVAFTRHRVVGGYLLGRSRTEALGLIHVRDFPVTVAIDTEGETFMMKVLLCGVRCKTL